MLYAVCCMLYAVRCMLYAVRCMLYAVCCMLYALSWAIPRRPNCCTSAQKDTTWRPTALGIELRPDALAAGFSGYSNRLPHPWVTEWRVSVPWVTEWRVSVRLSDKLWHNSVIKWQLPTSIYNSNIFPETRKNSCFARLQNFQIRLWRWQ